MNHLAREESANMAFKIRGKSQHAAWTQNQLRNIVDEKSRRFDPKPFPTVRPRYEQKPVRILKVKWH